MKKEIKLDELKEGITKGVNNAISLYREAELLEKNDYLARAYTLYHIALEEASKVEHLVYKSPNIFARKEKLFFSDMAKFFTQHKSKLKAFAYNSKMAKEERDLIKSDASEWRKYFKGKQNDLYEQMNRNKNNSLYLSYNEDTGKFLSPSDLIDKETLWAIKRDAEIIISQVVRFEHLFNGIFDSKEAQDKWLEFEKRIEENPIEFQSFIDELTQEK